MLDGNSLSLSKFDVSGSKTQKGLKGYIYGERGVWRPGDSIHLTFLLNDADNKLPKNHPVKLEVTDPSGKLMYKNVTSENLIISTNLQLQLLKKQKQEIILQKFLLVVQSFIKL